MSTVHRNDPCPCGSGRKYKKCCMPADEKREHALRLVGADESVPRRRSDLRNLEIGTVWQVDLAPLVMTLDDDPSARPAMLLVMSADVIIHGDMVSHPPSEYDAIAALLESAIDAAIAASNVVPTELQLRYGELAIPLAARLDARGIAVRDLDRLPHLDAALDDFNRRLVRQSGITKAGPPPRGIRVSSPSVWSGWDLSRDQVGQLFSAAAFYYRSAPWRWLVNVQILHCRMPNGDRWDCVVLGHAGVELGLNLYARYGEIAGDGVANWNPPIEPEGKHVVLSLTFDSSAETPSAAIREIRAARWVVAGENAYPSLMVFNTPGGGLTRKHAEELTALLSVIPRFVELHRSGLIGDEPLDLPLEWTDDATGVVVGYQGFDLSASARKSLWGVPSALEPALARGAAAEPATRTAGMSAPDDGGSIEDDPDALTDAELRIVERFAEHLDLGGGGRPLSGATITKHCNNAALLTEFLTSYQRIPLRSITEYDLRVFLYDWFPRKVRTSRTRAGSLLVSLRRFFRYLADVEGIDCPWAERILHDEDVFMKRRRSLPGGPFWSTGVNEWKSELYANLYARVLLHETRAAGQQQTEWGGDDGMMGPVEAELDVALQRLWLLWREEEILRGNTSPEALRAVLVPRQRAWERTPNVLVGGSSPSDAIARERADRKKRFPGGPEIPSGRGAHASTVDTASDGYDGDFEDDVFDADEAQLADMDDAIDRLVDEMSHDPEISGKGELLRAALESEGGADSADSLVASLLHVAESVAAARSTRTNKKGGRGKHGARRHVGPPVIYQLRLSLLGIEPPIWRRIQVRSSVTLERLHRIVQIAMGWEDAHLYEFESGGVRYSPSEHDLLSDSYDSWTTRLGDLGMVPGSVLRYTYDMGDSWEHELVVESVESAQPASPESLCVGGERACPPEDSGGIFGYEELLAALRGEARSRDEYDEWLENLVDQEGRPFDPERFELERVNDVLLRK